MFPKSRRSIIDTEIIIDRTNELLCWFFSMFIRYPVTRVWYTENFNDSKKQWPNPNLARRLDNINNELSASNKNIYIDEIQKLYEINLEGNVHVSWTHDVNNSTVMGWKKFNKGKLI